MRTNDEAYLILGRVAKDVPVRFHCSLCSQAFTLNDDKTPERAVMELWEAFTGHLKKEHPIDHSQ
jgi:hypothetical protein